MTMRLPAFPPKRPGVVCNWPTSEDWEFFFHHCLTRFANPCHPHCADGRRSHRYDGDWSRAMQPTASMAPLPTCPTDFYPMGTLNGVWQGSFIVSLLVCIEGHMSLTSLSGSSPGDLQELVFHPRRTSFVPAVRSSSVVPDVERVLLFHGVRSGAGGHVFPSVVDDRLSGDHT
jgi:hypothetical protein